MFEEHEKLTGQLVTLEQLISYFTDRLKPFFITLRRAKRNGRNEECDQAFTVIKQYLTEPPILIIPKAGDTLYLYLAMSKASISTSLFKEDENRKKRPIFFMSKSLFKAERRYTCLKQAALALHMATKKLRPYFQAHPIVVLTNLPLRSTIHKPNLSGRMAQWAIELMNSVFNINLIWH